MPVSMDGLGSGVIVPAPSRLNCMKTRFQISSQRSQSHAGPRQRRPACSLAHGRWSPWWKWVSEQGPHGPVSPIDQKLSASPNRRMRSSPMPATFFQSLMASSSPSSTVALIRSLGSPHFSVISSQQNRIASSLK